MKITTTSGNTINTGKSNLEGWISTPDKSSIGDTFYPGGSSSPIGNRGAYVDPITLQNIRNQEEIKNLKELLEKALINSDNKIDSLRESLEFLLGQVIELKALLQNNKENTPISSESSSTAFEVTTEDKRFKLS